MALLKNYTFKVYKDGKMIQRCASHSRRRFTNHLGTINWQLGYLKVSLRVGYGSHKDVFDKTVPFRNEGDYFNKIDLFQAFNAFDELKEEDFV